MPTSALFQHPLQPRASLQKRPDGLFPQPLQCGES